MLRLAAGVALSCMGNGKILHNGVLKTCGFTAPPAMPAAGSARRWLPGTSWKGSPGSPGRRRGRHAEYPLRGGLLQRRDRALSPG
jgi:hypothetical protein